MPAMRQVSRADPGAVGVFSLGQGAFFGDETDERP